MEFEKTARSGRTGTAIPSRDRSTHRGDSNRRRLLEALKARQARQQRLQNAIAAAAHVQAARLDRHTVERHVRARLTQWRELLTAAVPDGRQLLREIPHGPIRFAPVEGQRRTYGFSGQVELGRLFSGLALHNALPET